MAKIGCIDIGTNSVRILGLEINDKGDINQILRDMRIIRLGAGMGLKGKIATYSMDLLIDTLNYFQEIGGRHGIKRYYAVCTSAVRSAKNKEEFINYISKATKIPLKVLSGEEEGNLAFMGATEKEPSNKKICVIDIGGGSTEIILGKGKVILDSKSVDIGAVWMTEKFLSSDPISSKEYKIMLDNVKKSFSESLLQIKEKSVNIDSAIGIGGTITTLASILLKMEIYNPEKICGFSFDLNQLKAIINKLLRKDLNDRKNIPGLQPGRVDIIPAGAGILYILMKELGLCSIKVKDTDLLMGMAIKIFQNELF